MIRLAFLVVVSWLAGEVAAHAQTQQSSILHLHEWILPELKVKDVTLREGVEIMRQAWVQRYPKEAFPVLLLERADDRTEGEERTSFDFHDIPAIEAMRYLAYWTSSTVSLEMDVLVVRPIFGSTRAHDAERTPVFVSDRAARTLGLSAEADEDGPAVGAKLAAHGIKSENWGLLRWNSRGKFIFIESTAYQVSLLKGLLLLLDAGFEIRKEEAK